MSCRSVAGDLVGHLDQIRQAAGRIDERLILRTRDLDRGGGVGCRLEVSSAVRAKSACLWILFMIGLSRGSSPPNVLPISGRPEADPAASASCYPPRSFRAMSRSVLI